MSIWMGRWDRKGRAPLDRAFDLSGMAWWKMVRRAADTLELDAADELEARTPSLDPERILLLREDAGWDVDDCSDCPCGVCLEEHLDRLVDAVERIATMTAGDDVQRFRDLFVGAKKDGHTVYICWDLAG